MITLRSARRPQKAVTPCGPSRRLRLATWFAWLWSALSVASAQEPPAQQTPPNQTPAGKQTPPKGTPGKTDQSTQPQSADNSPPPKKLPEISPEARYDFQGEATFILQNALPFHSPYAGPNSLQSRNETELSASTTLYLGVRLNSQFEVYIDPEIAWGNGIGGGGKGLAGYTNGDIIGQPVLSAEPYLARYFVRWRIPTGRAGDKIKETQAGRSPNIIAGNIPAHRLLVSFGKMAVSDFFDVNAYANNPRTQFLNNAFVNNLAYDFAQETRGYDLGLVVGWINPMWSVEVGSFAMPTTAGGPDLAYSLARDHGDQLEGELHSRLFGKKLYPFVTRLLAYRNMARMGSFSDALAAEMPGAPPDLASVRRNGAVKYGFGLNFEQPLRDDTNTGIFGRVGWNNGATESFAYAEADRSISLGAQVSGASWGRKDDRVGLAWEQSDLSSEHRDYLAAGGLGLNLGDGKLNYAPEQILETYYSYQFNKAVALSLDYQYISDPGYNRDRGPVSVFSLRAHISF